MLSKPSKVAFVLDFKSIIYFLFYIFRQHRSSKKSVCSFRIYKQQQNARHLDTLQNLSLTLNKTFCTDFRSCGSELNMSGSEQNLSGMEYLFIYLLRNPCHHRGSVRGPTHQQFSARMTVGHSVRGTLLAQQFITRWLRARVLARRGFYTPVPWLPSSAPILVQNSMFLVSVDKFSRVMIIDCLSYSHHTCRDPSSLYLFIYDSNIHHPAGTHQVLYLFIYCGCHL